MCQAESGYASDRGMLLGAWHLQLEQQQQQRVAALGCVCASSLERSRRCQKVAPQLSSTSLADASRSAKREGKVVSNVSNPRSCLNPPSPPLGSVTVSPASFLERLQSEPFTALAFVVICYRRRRRRRHGKLLQFQHDPPISAPLPSSPFPIHIRCGSSVNCFACELFSASTPYSSPPVPVPAPSLYFE